MLLLGCRIDSKNGQRLSPADRAQIRPDLVTPALNAVTAVAAGQPRMSEHTPASRGIGGAFQMLEPFFGLLGVGRFSKNGLPRTRPAAQPPHSSGPRSSPFLAGRAELHTDQGTQRLLRTTVAGPWTNCNKSPRWSSAFSLSPSIAWARIASLSLALRASPQQRTEAFAIGMLRQRADRLEPQGRFVLRQQFLQEGNAQPRVLGRHQLQGQHPRRRRALFVDQALEEYSASLPSLTGWPSMRARAVA